MSLLRAASSISALTLASRILGLLRDALSTWLFGAGPVAGAFHLAWLLPNLLRRLLGEGALSAAFVPAYGRLLHQGDDEGAGRLLGAVTGSLLWILGPSALAVALWSLSGPDWDGLPLAWSDAAPDPGAADAPAAPEGLLGRLLAILFPYVVPICWLAILAGAANCLGVFAVPAAAPVVLNVFWIAGLGTTLALGWTGASGERLADAALLVAAFLLAGGFAQLLLGGVLPLVRRGRFRLPSSPDRSSAAVLTAMLPTALGLGVSQLNVLLDQLLAYAVVGPGSNVYVYLANRLLLFPHALVALPVGVAVFPELARLAAAGSHDALRQTLTRASRATWMLAVPAALGLSLVAEDLIRVVFERGLFDAEDTPRAAWTTVALVAGLPAVSVAALATRTLYAFGHYRRAALVAAAFAPLNLALNLLFLAAGLGVAGLALATTICSWCQLVWLHVEVERRLAPDAARPAGFGRTAACTAVSSAAMAASVLGSRALTGPGVLGLVVPIGVGGAVYAATMWTVGDELVRDVVRRIRRRLVG